MWVSVRVGVHTLDVALRGVGGFFLVDVRGVAVRWGEDEDAPICELVWF